MTRRSFLPCLGGMAFSSGSPDNSKWWQDQVNVVSWGTLARSGQSVEANYVRQCGATIVDRGLPAGTPDAPKPIAARDVRIFKENGFRVTSFTTIEGWDPGDAAVSRLLAFLKGHVAAGCDGVHLDMLFIPKAGVPATSATRRIRDEMHNAGTNVLFAGNLWMLDRSFALEAARLTDVIWTESYGNSESQVVRIARTGAGLGEFAKPVWYHWQPDTDTQARVINLHNLSRALFSSCLLEGAVFLCNYQYPVLVTWAGGHGDWTMFHINDGWRRNVIRYSAFVRQYREFFLGTHPESDVLVAFRPAGVTAATAIMDSLIQRRIDFNVLVYGDDPMPARSAKDLARYRHVISPEADERQAFHSVPAFLSAWEGPRLLRIEGADNVLGRVFLKDGKRTLRLKQLGYNEEADDLPPIGPLEITMYAPGVAGGFAVSPDLSDVYTLKLSRAPQPLIRFTVPRMQYFSLVVLN